MEITLTFDGPDFKGPTQLTFCNVVEYAHTPLFLSIRVKDEDDIYFERKHVIKLEVR